MPLRVFFLRVCKRLCTGSSFSSSHGWTTSFSILRQNSCLCSLFRSFYKASDQMCCFNVDRFLGRKLHSSVQIYGLSNFVERSAPKRWVKLPSKPLEKYLRRIGPAALKEINCCLNTGCRFWADFTRHLVVTRIIFVQSDNRFVTR